MKKAISILVIMVVIVALFPCKEVVAAGKLSSRQLAREKTIAKICIDNWSEYGVLPSVCLAQAMQESTLGEHCKGYNFWGINSGRGYNYSSLNEGTMAYLKVINNGYYKKAPFQKNYRKQLQAIMNGGYCNPPYTNTACWLIKHYNFDKYDKQLFKKLDQERERKRIEKLRSQGFTLCYSKDVSENACLVSKEVAKKGTVSVWVNDELMNIYDVVPADIPKNEIYITGWHKSLSREVRCEFNDNARG